MLQDAPEFVRGSAKSNVKRNVKVFDTEPIASCTRIILKNRQEVVEDLVHLNIKIQYPASNKRSYIRDRVNR